VTEDYRTFIEQLIVIWQRLRRNKPLLYSTVFFSVMFITATYILLYLIRLADLELINVIASQKLRSLDGVSAAEHAHALGIAAASCFLSALALTAFSVLLGHKQLNALTGFFISYSVLGIVLSPFLAPLIGIDPNKPAGRRPKG
jgi:hypothetical protein